MTLEVTFFKACSLSSSLSSVIYLPSLFSPGLILGYGHFLLHFFLPVFYFEIIINGIFMVPLKSQWSTLLGNIHTTIKKARVFSHVALSIGTWGPTAATHQVMEGNLTSYVGTVSETDLETCRKGDTKRFNGEQQTERWVLHRWLHFSPNPHHHPIFGNELVTFLNVLLCLASLQLYFICDSYNRVSSFQL